MVWRIKSNHFLFIKMNHKIYRNVLSFLFFISLFLSKGVKDNKYLSVRIVIYWTLVFYYSLMAIYIYSLKSMCSIYYYYINNILDELYPPFTLTTEHFYEKYLAGNKPCILRWVMLNSISKEFDVALYIWGFLFPSLRYTFW